MEAGGEPGRLDVVPGAVQHLGVLEGRRPGRRGSPAAPRCPAAPTAQAPPPRRAYQRSRSAGADTTPSWSWPSTSRARSVPNSGHAADEVVGPVDRVDVPADRGVGRLGPVLLADEAVIREGGRDPLPDQPLDRLVGGGHERSVGLGHHLDVAPEVAQGDLVGRVAGGLGEGQPVVELVGRGARPARAPGRPERGLDRGAGLPGRGRFGCAADRACGRHPAVFVGHDRILAPFGS